MFTGIVDHFAPIERVENRDGTLRLTIASRFEDLQMGESIAVDGACLTVVAIQGGTFDCELSSETRARTICDGYQVGTRLNLERALRLSDRLGGHLVTGHVDTRLRCLQREDLGEFSKITFESPAPEYLRYVFSKGCITINGVSLTLNQVSPQSFDVMLIPHTLERTTLHGLKKNESVNIEFDWMVKVVLREAERIRDIKL